MGTLDEKYLETYDRSMEDMMLYVIASLVTFVAFIKTGIFGVIPKETSSGRTIVRCNTYRVFESLKFLIYFLYFTYIGFHQYYFNDKGDRTITMTLAVLMLVTTLGMPIVSKLTSSSSDEI